MTITQTWTSTGINGNQLGSGTYFMQLWNYNSFNVGGGSYEEYYAGFLGWFSGNTNNVYVDNIYVHHSGHATNGEDLQFRTVRGINNAYNGVQLEVRSDQYDHTGNSTLYLSFRKIM